MRIVQKYGGTSVADIARLENVALRVKHSLDSGNKIVVVVSAMAGVTNQLVAYTKSFSNIRNSPEHDAVFSTGEQITTGLLSLALQQLGIKSRSFMGWQIPITTTDQHTNAQILNIDPIQLEHCLQNGIIPIVAGFQGITLNNRITTLGRGGSDTTAVAIAAAINADRCDIYTDVDGVYTADPKIVIKAKKIQEISYLEMLELSTHGAKVLHSRSVETAMRHFVRVRVLSSFNNQPGTDIFGVPPINIMRISGITYSLGWVMIHLDTDRFQLDMFQSLQQTIKNSDIQTDFFTVTENNNETRISFLLQKSDFAKAIQSIEKNHYYAQYKNLHVQSNFAKISIVGIGLLGELGLTQHFLEIQTRIKVQSYLTYLSNNRISFSINEESTESTVKLLHTEFGMDQNNG